MGRTAALDPDAPDFASQVADLVREAAGQPRYQFVQPPAPAQPPAAPAGQQQAPAAAAQPPQMPEPTPPAAASGADFTGAPPGDFYWSAAYYEAYKAWARHGDPKGEILMKAMDEGRLAQLGIGTTRGKSRRR
jgi:hypothetical protein